MRFLLVSGGSGGHLAPLLAVGRELEALSPGAELLYACADQDSDRAFLDAHGVKHVSLAWPRRAMLSPGAWVKNLAQARIALEMHKPAAVFSNGGSVSLPTCVLARGLRVPVTLHESDAVWGRANKTGMRFATKICLGWDSAAADKRVIVTGNPVRAEVTRGSREEGLRIAGLDGKKPVLLVMGGSQGALAVNAAVADVIDALLAVCDVIHLTGEGKKGASPRPGYFALPFARDELPHLYAASTVALSRAGAGGIAELAANGIPTILVPLRGVAQDHQLANALAARDAGGCTVLEQETLRAALTPAVTSLLEPGTRKAASTAIRALHHPDAARKIAETVLSTVKR